MSLADATVSALKAFATEVNTWTNQGSLVSIDSHIATIENAAAQDVHAGETAAKAVLAELYGAFHGHETAPLAEAPAAPAAEPVPSETSAVAAPTAPAIPPAEVTATAAADPTAAPSTTEASSAPSSETPNASSTAAPTDSPATPAV